MSKFRIVGALLLIIVVIAWYYHRQPSTQKILNFYGNVDIREVDLAFRVPGRVQRMMFEEGDHLEKGALMATLEQDTYLESLAMAKAQHQETKAALENAQIVYKRRSRLVRSGAVSTAQYDQAQAIFEESKARFQTTKVGIAQAQTALSDTKIIAPRSGTILTRVREPGTIVATGQTVYTLTVDNPVWIRAYVEEPHLGDIHPGQKALIYTDSRPTKPYLGHVGFISSQAEFTPKMVETTELRTNLVYRFRIVVSNPDNKLRQGMPVSIKIIESESNGKD